MFSDQRGRENAFPLAKGESPCSTKHGLSTLRLSSCFLFPSLHRDQERASSLVLNTFSFSAEECLSWMQTELGFTFYWDVRKLWEAELPIVPMRVQEFEWLLDKPFWKDGHKKLALSPRRVAADPERYRAEYERAMAADLSCPINVIFLSGRWVIMDGLHRLLKAWLCGYDTILTKQAHEQDIPLFIRKPTDPHNHP